MKSTRSQINHFWHQSKLWIVTSSPFYFSIRFFFCALCNRTVQSKTSEDWNGMRFGAHGDKCFVVWSYIYLYRAERKKEMTKSQVTSCVRSAHVLKKKITALQCIRTCHSIMHQLKWCKHENLLNFPTAIPFAQNSCGVTNWFHVLFENNCLSWQFAIQRENQWKWPSEHSATHGIQIKLKKFGVKTNLRKEKK